MKYLLSILSLALIGCFSSCNLFSSEDDEPKTELEKLPPLTTTGENTFGCLVNGEALVVTNTLEITAIYQGGVLQLGGG